MPIFRNLFFVFTIIVITYNVTALCWSAHALDPEPSRAPSVVIDCDRGDQPSDFLRRHRNVVVFEVRGVCELSEALHLERDDLTLRGAPGASLSGAGLVIHGISGIVVESLAVRKIPGVAVQITGGAEARLVDLYIEKAETAVLFVASSGEIDGMTVRNLQIAGIWNRSSNVVLGGHLDISSAGVAGLVATESGGFTVTDPDARLETSGSFYGVLLQDAGNLILEQGLLAARANDADGVRIYGRGFLTQEGGFLIAEGNGGFGVSIAQSADWIVSLAGTAASSLAANTSGGVLVVGGSTAALVGAEILDNGGVGVLADADAIVPLRDTRIRGNQAVGMFLSFGSVVSFFERNTIDDAVLCQEPVLVRGTPGCGSAAALSGELQITVERAIADAMKAPRLTMPR